MTQYDVKFLSFVLNISDRTVKKLTESEDDTNLMLKQASFKELNRDILCKCSAPIACKLLIFKYCNQSFSFAEQIYLGKCLSEGYDGLVKLLKKKNTKNHLKVFDNAKPSEETSRLMLVACGLFNFKGINYNKTVECMESGFRQNTHLRELALHVREWVKILNKIVEDGWFNKEKEPKSPTTLSETQESVNVGV